MSVALTVNETTQASGTATAAMTTVADFSTPNSGGLLDEVVRHIRANTQSMDGIQVQVNKLVQDFIVLNQDYWKRLPPAGGSGGGFLYVPACFLKTLTPVHHVTSL